MGCKRQGVIISELSSLRSRKRFLGVVVRDFVGTESCLNCAGPAFGIRTDNRLKVESSFVSDF